jgi:D-alanyl-D-alanine carboxypeptidase (penicillin-binding protein 5/6)
VFLVCLILVGSLGSLGFGPPVLTDGRHPPLRLDPDLVDRLRRLDRWPAVTAVSALVVDLDSGQTLYALRPHEPWPPASTVKLMTALVVLQRTNLTDPVVVSARAAATAGSRMGLVAGEVLTVQDLLYGLLLPSGNDATVALAEHVAGSESRFVALMNETAAGLGLTETRFANPHGIDDSDEMTSAVDLIKLTQAALAYPAFAQITAAERAQVAGRSLVNTNQLLRLYHGADGIKTGTTPAAGECLVASVTRAGHRLLVVVLGSRDRYADTVALLDHAAQGWQWRRVELPDNALAWEIGPDGKAYRLRAVGSVDLFLPAWQWQLVQPVRVLNPTAVFTSALPVGQLLWMLNGQVLAQQPLTIWPGP